MAASGSETVEVYAKPTRDRVGGQTRGELKGRIEDAVVWPITSTEDAERGQRITDGINVFFPGQLDFEVNGEDQVVARERVWDVEGNSGRYINKAGTEKGTLFAAVRAGV